MLFCHLSSNYYSWSRGFKCAPAIGMTLVLVQTLCGRAMCFVLLFFVQVAKKMMPRLFLWFCALEPFWVSPPSPSCAAVCPVCLRSLRSQGSITSSRKRPHQLSKPYSSRMLHRKAPHEPSQQGRIRPSYHLAYKAVEL